MADSNKNPGSKPSLGFGIFLILSGTALLAERLGWISKDVEWVLPSILIAWGLNELYERFSK